MNLIMIGWKIFDSSSIYKVKIEESFMFTPVTPLLAPYDALIEADRIASHFVVLPDDYDSSIEYDDYSDVVFDYDYDF